MWFLGDHSLILFAYEEYSCLMLPFAIVYEYEAMKLYQKKKKSYEINFSLFYYVIYNQNNGMNSVKTK